MYCVRPVPVELAVGAPVIPLGKSYDGGPREAHPGYLRLVPGAAFPILYDLHQSASADGKSQGYRPFWRLDPARKIVGPYLYDDSLSTDADELVSDNPGRTLLIGSRYGLDAVGKKQSQSRLYESVAGSEPRLVDEKLQAAVAMPTHLRKSRMLGGAVIDSRKQVEGNRYEVRSLLLRGENLEALDDVDVGLLADLPRVSLVAVLSGRALSFIHPDHRVEQITPLNPGDDYGGWHGFHETRDAGWFYADGVQYDHALKVEQRDGKWIAAEIVRIGDDQGLFETFMWWISGFDRRRMQRHRLSRMITAGACRRFSPAIGRMIFCDNMQEMRAGELRQIGDGSLSRHVGDAPRLGVALFLGKGGRVYAYDGDELLDVAGELHTRGMVHDIAGLGRTFISAKEGLFEIKGGADALKLVRLGSIEAPNLQFTSVLPSPDGREVLFFDGSGVYRSAGDRLVLIWQPGPAGRIDVTGSTVPTPVLGWNAILVATRKNVSGPAEFHLVERCGSNDTVQQ